MQKHKYSVLGCFKRTFGHNEHEVPEDIKSFFKEYSLKGEMNDECLHKFLAEVQREYNITREDTKRLMQDFLHKHKYLHFGTDHREILNIEGFLRYLLSEENPPLPPKVHHDMSAPLSHYFIYTSHNTYLKGNHQLTSRCSAKAIINALRKGVRVIELDLWPNSRQDGAVVKHGGTGTRPVKLIKCLRAIEKHAFDASEYPVIVTLEDHLTPDLRKTVAEMVTKTFREKLYITESLEEFPSPEELKEKILISTTPPREEYDGAKKMQIAQLIEMISCFNVEKDDEEDIDDHQDQDENIPELEQTTTPEEYKSLIAIPLLEVKGKLEAWLGDHPHAHRVSLSEKKLEKAVSSHGTHISEFTRKNLMRVYPQGYRIFSSNYNPFPAWMHGVQMVAFNVQKTDWTLQLMQGMFRANGGCGYVEKPSFLPKGTELFNLPPKTLKVKVYMGEGWHLDFHRTHFDWWSPPDFYVKIGITGAHDDPKQKRTESVSNSWKPVWNEEFEFPVLVPELTILTVEVRESDTMIKKDDFGGQTCLPVGELREGIRAVPLYNRRGIEYKHVKLLMRFEHEERKSWAKEFEGPYFIKELFEKYSRDQAMSYEHLHKFLKEVQGEDNITLEDTKQLIQSVMHEHKRRHLGHGENLNIEGFFWFLLSGVNSPLPPKVHHDMNAPLSHYFIYTSCNTYLDGNRTTSKCSDRPIINALKRGIRVIELAMWPNSRKDDVVVMHEGTITRSVELIKCLTAIKKYAFESSDYPVIVTLEDHLTPELQEKVAVKVTETFDDMLYRSESLNEFPSPEALKRKIIISTKPAKEDLDQGEDPELQGTTPPNYESLIAIPSHRTDRKLKTWLTKPLRNAHCISLSEENLERAVTTCETNIVRFNQKNLMRVYPKGTRLSSSSYNPFVGWKHGVQMVAFNTQGHEKYHWVIQGMFRANGGCGYVKKPDFLLKGTLPSEPPPVKKSLKVKIYMGEVQQDRQFPPDFYVKIGIAEVDAYSMMEKTKIIKDNWKPEWNQEFKFPLSVPELAILGVEVHELARNGKTDDLAGQTCLPVWELKTGIRAVSLHNRRGVMKKSMKLLMRFDFI